MSLNKDKVIKFLAYKAINAAAGLILLWLFIDVLSIPISNTITRGIIYASWIGVSFFIYDKKIFVTEKLTLDACKSLLEQENS